MAGNSEKNLFVLIACDVDPLAGQNFLNTSTKETIWDDTLRAVINLKQILEKIKDTSSHSPKFTWFLRSDWETYRTCDDWCYPVSNYTETWKDFQRSGDEIGWHPHLARLNEGKKSWYQETEDIPWMMQCLDKGYQELSHHFSIQSSRAGWTFHSNDTMKMISDLGIMYDVSAMPEYFQYGGFDDNLDWRNTPLNPYHPSANDYRVRGTGAASLKVLEIPVSVYPLPYPFNVLLKKQYKHYNLAANPLIFSKMSENLFAESTIVKKCIMSIHPSDISQKKAISDPLSNCRKNIISLLRKAERRDYPVRFLTAGEFGNFWKQTIEIE